MEQIDRLFEFLQDFFAKYDILDSVSFPVSLAAEEIFTNCVKYNPSGGGPISISLENKGEYLELRLTDPGVEFDPRRMPEVNTDLPLSERKVGGLGIHLAKQLMDSMDYSYQNGKNIIILIKKTGI